MRKKIEILISFILVISVTTTCFSVITRADSTTYYVSQTGNDNNDGTISSPWRTLQKAANTVNAGDTVYVRGGTYNELVDISNSGTSSAWITFKNYPNELPVIDGKGKTPGYWAGGIIQVSDTSYIMIDGFKVQNSGESGICVLRSTYVTVQNCQTTNTGYSGIRVCYGEGVSKQKYCSNIKILNNIIALSNTAQNQEALTLSGVSNSEIKYNTLTSTCKKEGIDCKHDCYYITIAYNNIATPGVNIYVGDSPNNGAHDFKVYGNYCHGSSTGIGISMEKCGSSENYFIYNNIFAGNSGFQIYTGGSCSVGPSNVYLINNVFDNCGIRFNPATTQTYIRNAVVRNNIFKSSNAIDINSKQPINQITIDHNFFTDSSSYKGTDYLTGDPKFVSTTDYHLQSTSPCINTGSSNGASNFDYEGHSRPYGTAIDIGAYEYGSTTVVDVVEFNHNTPSTTTPTSVVAPTVITNTAKSITSNSAILNSNLDNMGGATSCEIWFQYGTTTSYGSTTTHQTKTSTGSFSTNIGSLKANTLYYFRAVTSNTAGTSYGTGMQFTTPTTTPTSVVAPTVITNTAKSITSNSAILNSNLDNMGGATSCEIWFQYGTTTSYGSTTTHQTKTSTGSFSTNIGSLKANTLYYFRAVTSNTAGTSYGTGMQFTTPTTTPTSVVAPTVITNTAKSITSNSAILNSNLDNMGGATSCEIWFQYGTTTSYGSTTTHQTKTSTGSFSTNIGSLKANTLYYFRAVTSNTAGTSYGTGMQFTTPTTTPTSVVAPTVITNTAKSITSNSAILNSNLDNMGGATSCEIWFQYGTTTSYGSTTTHQTKTSTGSFSTNIGSLKANTLYYFRAVTSNTAGTSYGTRMQFTTPTTTTTTTTTTKPTTTTTTTKTTITTPPITTPTDNSEENINNLVTKPTINGKNNGIKDKEYEYKFVSTNPEGDNIYYCINWGDGTNEVRIGPYEPGQEASFIHKWSEKGNYIIKVKVIDANGAESDGATFKVDIIYNTIQQLLTRILERYPYFENILNIHYQ